MVSETLTFTEGRWTPACNSQGVVDADGSSDCGIARACPGVGISASYFSRTVTTRDGTLVDASDWAFVDRRCITFDPDNPPESVTGAPAVPMVTWQMVLREVERMGLPSLRVQVQPEDKTLVNFRTNFYAEPEAFERQITLLGQTVDVRAEPTRFHWAFGDGGADATESAGSPYPGLEVTHAYSDAQVTVRPSVDVTYVAEFRVDGGPWQEIPQTVRIGGPPVPLRVVEATPVLSGEGQEP